MFSAGSKIITYNMRSEAVSTFISMITPVSVISVAVGGWATVPHPTTVASQFTYIHKQRQAASPVPEVYPLGLLGAVASIFDGDLAV